jgi:hypothetical protein
MRAGGLEPIIIAWLLLRILASELMNGNKLVNSLCFGAE